MMMYVAMVLLLVVGMALYYGQKHLRGMQDEQHLQRATSALQSTQLEELKKQVAALEKALKAVTNKSA
jgi:cell division protein FtsL